MQEEKEEIKEGTYIVTLRLFRELSERISEFMGYIEHAEYKHPELLKLKDIVARFTVMAMEIIEFYRKDINLSKLGKASRREHKIPRAQEDNNGHIKKTTSQ